MGVGGLTLEGSLGMDALWLPLTPKRSGTSGTAVVPRNVLFFFFLVVALLIAKNHVLFLPFKHYHTILF